ncbi:MAG: DNA-directed RNA polymerase subunit beta [Armatimonadota bacterium]
MKEIQHRTKRTEEFVELPNLVAIQLDSYEWFIKEGLKELFQSFSPIYDFTGNLSLEFIDYSLGEPKYPLEECRYRDMTTYEAPIKALVRLTSAENEVIESEVYLGDLPIMTDKGTFVINGAERVVVSQLARSPGVYFREQLDYSGRVLYYATVIPNSGAWIDIETEPNNEISVKVAQTKKFPLTTLLRALTLFEPACPNGEMMSPKDAIGKEIVSDIINPKNDEIVYPAGTVVDDAMVAKLKKLNVDEVEVMADNCSFSTDLDILNSMANIEICSPVTAEYILGKRPTKDIVDEGNGKVIVKAGEKINDEDVAKKIESMGLGSLEVYDLNKYIDATLDADTTHNANEALIDIFHRMRPGDPATLDSATSLINSYFFDTKRYDLAKVGRYKVNKKLGLKLSEKVRGITCRDLQSIIEYIIGLSESGFLVSCFKRNEFTEKISELEKALKKEEKSAPAEEKIPGGRIQVMYKTLEFLKTLKFGTMITETRLKEIKELLKIIPDGNKIIAQSPADLNSDTLIRLHSCTTDDIDHLENKRVRSVGELLQDQLRSGFLRMEKVAKERMTSIDPENIMPQVILSVKPVSASIKTFFGSGQLSQFMDQTNPLAELTHKRRLSALGPGGLSRQSAKLEVRDVHHSHYGRICPIETPEGPNIGLIGSMAVHAKIDKYGFLRTPYRKVVNGKVTDIVEYLSADEENSEYVASSNTPIDPETKKIMSDTVIVRHEHEYPHVPSNKVTYMDISPMQIMSVAAAMIPFLENDDANRALMGSNMQRQAVPLLKTNAPIVRTGVEARAARDSGAVVIAKRNGIVRKSTADQIQIEAEDGTIDTYNLFNLMRSNQKTCITQKPLVKVGDRVKADEVIADGPCTDNGELALGQNILVAFMPWNGYNYEDAILLSKRLVKDDVFTSVHVEKFETEARDTKLGPEEITRDIPNVGEDVLKDLDSNGIIRIGAEVKPEDILVGKVAPKGQSELTAEERLIIAIFGKKAEETRDVSLRVPHGEGGTVVDVKVFSRFKYKCSREECGAIYNFSKKPDRLMCERCDAELVREQADELSAGVNMLVRVYIAQKRKIMEGDKMAGRHGNKGVISKIFPEEDMPFMPDGTPVDIVLNPLGVPSRMNIGQILETHQGMVGYHLGCRFKNPIFQGANEHEILTDLRILSWKLKLSTLREYIKELGIDIEIPSDRKIDLAIKQILNRLGDVTGEELDIVDEPVKIIYDNAIQSIREYIKNLNAADLEILSIKLGGPVAVEDPDIVRQALSEKLLIENEKRKISEDPEYIPSEEIDLNKEIEIPFSDVQAPKDFDYEALIKAIEENVKKRVGFNCETAKSKLIDGRTGQEFSQEVTVGYIYMLKLVHLVEDKLHARSTGPYSLVTQQPLGGKAQFGGQRFGEMEVWALEAYGAAYTLQEILTIKSDDVQGRVKTYESIVKGDSILEPGIPESFKILVNELQSLCLKVTVEDDQQRTIDLKASEDEFSDSHDGRLAGGGRKKKVLELKEDI